MTEDGIVTSINNNLVTVQMEKGDQCKECNICETIGGGFRCIEALNTLNAKAGDRVRVEIEPKTMLTSSFLVFILPLIFLVVGYFIGSSLGAESASEGYGILGGLLFLALSFVVVKYLDKYKSKNQQTYAKVIELLSTH